MSSMHDESEPPHDGVGVGYMMNRCRQMAGVGCLGCMVNRNHQMRGMFSTYDEPESPNEGACLRYVMYRSHQIRGRRY